MTERTADQIREAVRAAYGARAQAVRAGRAADCCGDSSAAGAAKRLYTVEDLERLPESAVSYGCGNPVAIAGLRPGETVLDLGSGAGLDCFLAAQRVGAAGRVIGLDMTDEMLTLAEQNRAKLGLANVEFRRGVIEALPLGDASVDVIISNCVINLSPDKDAVFAESFRVLRPGGRVHVSDVVLLQELSPAERNDLNRWSGCIAGALAKDDYARRLAAAGFTGIAVGVQENEDADDKQKTWRSALITTYKPGGERKPPRLWQGERIELTLPAGLQTAACCDGDCCTIEEPSEQPEPKPA